MFGILQQFSYHDYIAREESKHQTAKKLGKNYCLKCGFCCLRRPCIPTPQEFYKIAKHLNLSPEKALKKHFVIDSLQFGGTKFIFPAKTTQLDITGKYIPSNRTFDEGYCNFFDEKKRVCAIYPVRPLTAQIQSCWDDKDSPNDSVKKWEGFDFEKLGITFDNENDDDDWD